MKPRWSAVLPFMILSHMLHLWCMATCCIVGLSHKTSDNQGTQCWWICDVGYNHACSAVLVPCYVLLIRIVVHYSLVSGAAVIFLIYGSKYGAGAWFGVDKSHLAKSRPAPLTGKHFSPVSAFSSKFSIESILQNKQQTIVSWLRLRHLPPPSHRQASSSLENPPKVATHPS